MELRNLKTFRTIAVLGSFNQAAKVLHYAQSTISDQIKSLEEELNVKLFDRSSKIISLTQEGTILLKYAQKILDLEDEVKAEVITPDKPVGAISVRIPQTISTYFMPDVVQKFSIEYPGFKLNFNNCTFYSLEQEFQSGITNLAFLITETKKFSSYLDNEKLSELEMVFISNPLHPLLKKKEITEKDVANEMVFLPSNDCNYRNIFDRLMTEAKTEAKKINIYNSVEAIKTSIIAGNGIGFLPLISVQREIDEQKLKVFKISNMTIMADFIMLWRKDKWISPVLDKFMQLTRDYIKLKKE